jgi:hypothetical protein
MYPEYREKVKGLPVAVYPATASDSGVRYSENTKT